MDGPPCPRIGPPAGLPARRASQFYQTRGGPATPARRTRPDPARLAEVRPAGNAGGIDGDDRDAHGSVTAEVGVVGSMRRAEVATVMRTIEALDRGRPPRGGPRRVPGRRAGLPARGQGPGGADPLRRLAGGAGLRLRARPGQGRGRGGPAADRGGGAAGPRRALQGGARRRRRRPRTGRWSRCSTGPC